LKKVFNLYFTPKKPKGKGEQAKKMANKSERAAGAMPEPGFNKRFPEEKAAAGRLVDIRYDGGPVCPRCGAKANIRGERERLKVFRCSGRNNSFSPVKGTIFEKTRIRIITRFKAVANLLNDRAGYSACRVARDFNAACKTARRMLARTRTAMANRESEHISEALAEAGETHTGGKPGKGNAAPDKDGNTVKAAEPENKRGRGAKKIPVAGVKERSGGQSNAAGQRRKKAAGETAC
jgi:hypothetical protein